MAEWTTNVDVEGLSAWLVEGKRFAVLTHTKPDGDAVGSTIAMVRALRVLCEQKGGDPSQIKAHYAGALPRWLGDIAFEDEYQTASVNELEALDPDRIVVCDTGAWNQLREVAPFLEDRTERIAIVDHHLTGDGEIGERRLIETSAAAVCQPVARICANLLGCAMGELAREIAEPLYLGIATDTGWFRHSNVSPAVLRDAATLLEAGVDHPRLLQQTEQRDPAGRVLLMGRVLAGMELHHDGQLAVLRVKLDDVHDVKLGAGQTGGIGEAAMNIASVRVCATLTETDETPAITKVSMRSKEDEHPVDVAEVARGFGGGGHARAAGARAAGEMDEVAAELVEAVGAALRP